MSRSAFSHDLPALKREIERLSSLDLDALRTAWRIMFKRHGKGLSRSILLRTMAWRIQEQAFGGHDAATLKALARYTKKPCGCAARKLRTFQPGTVLVREYRGTRHLVTAVIGGFVWRGQTYPSLTQIAFLITGTKWSGPRFFGVHDTPRKAGPEPQGAR
jgi:hypothetical protein